MPATAARRRKRSGRLFRSLARLFDSAGRPMNLKRFWRGEGPERLPATLGRRRVYILPTGAGVAFGLVLLVMLIGAINYNNSLGYLLTFLLGSTAVVGIFHTYRNLLGLRVALGAVEPAFAGEPLRVPVLLDNTGLGGRLALHLSLPEGSGAPPPGIETDVPPDEWQRVVLSRPARARGRRPVGRVTLSTRYPLGLFRAWAHVVPDVECLIYPRPYPQRGLPPGVQYEASLIGDQGRGSDDFAGFRNYHAGDSLRHINWKAVAREQGLLTKRFGGDRVEELWLDWAALPGLDREARLSRLTRWVLDAEAAGLSYGLRLPGTRIAPGHGPAHRRRCLEALALFEAPAS